MVENKHFILAAKKYFPLAFTTIMTIMILFIQLCNFVLRANGIFYIIEELLGMRQLISSVVGKNRRLQIN